jgi:hypothetical protein
MEERFMLNTKITELDQLQQQFENAKKALAALGGTITTPKFDPNDPARMQESIRQMEAAIDDKLASSRKGLVSLLVEKMKERGEK